MKERRQQVLSSEWTKLAKKEWSQDCVTAGLQEEEGQLDLPICCRHLYFYWGERVVHMMVDEEKQALRIRQELEEIEKVARISREMSPGIDHGLLPSEIGRIVSNIN